MTSSPSGSDRAPGGLQLRRRLFERGGAITEDITDLPCRSGEAAFAAAGDVDGDGFADVLGACGSTSSARPNPALVRVYHGSPDGLARPEDLDLTSERSIVGADVRGASLGDVDGDGHADVVLGANCVETDADTGDSCLRREHYLLRGGADGVSPSRMQPVPE